MTDLRRLIDGVAPRERGGSAPPHASLYPSFARMSLTAARYVLLTTLLPGLDPRLVKKALGLEGDRLPYWRNPPAEDVSVGVAVLRRFTELVKF